MQHHMEAWYCKRHARLRTTIERKLQLYLRNLEIYSVMKMVSNFLLQRQCVCILQNPESCTQIQNYI